MRLTIVTMRTLSIEHALGTLRNRSIQMRWTLEIARNLVLVCGASQPLSELARSGSNSGRGRGVLKLLEACVNWACGRPAGLPLLARGGLIRRWHACT